MHVLNSIAELIIPTGTPSKQVKAEIEIYPVTAEAKIINQFILVYFFNEINFCYFYILQSKFFGLCFLQPDFITTFLESIHKSKF